MQGCQLQELLISELLSWVKGIWDKTFALCTKRSTLRDGHLGNAKEQAFRI